jgi:hypothetical protein
MTTGGDSLSKADTVTIAAIETGLPTLVEAREIIAGFHQMLRRKLVDGLTAWIERARSSLVASFASGVARIRAPFVPRLRLLGQTARRRAKSQRSSL